MIQPVLNNHLVKINIYNPLVECKNYLIYLFRWFFDTLFQSGIQPSPVLF